MYGKGEVSIGTILILILLAILGIIFLLSSYSVIYYLKIFASIAIGIFSFVEFYAYFRKMKIHKWISFGLSFLLASGLIIWAYNSWAYIAVILIMVGIAYFVSKTLGINILEYIKELGRLFEKKGGKR